jgi:hypothetical protein
MIKLMPLNTDHYTHHMEYNRLGVRTIREVAGRDSKMVQTQNMRLPFSTLNSTK